MLRTYRIRLYPTAEQQQKLAVQFGYAAMTARLPILKEQLPWLLEADSQVLQQS